jgi:hypothetical protein
MSLPTFLVFGELVQQQMGEKKDSQIQILSAKISTNSDALSKGRDGSHKALFALFSPLLLLLNRYDTGNICMATRR